MVEPQSMTSEFSRFKASLRNNPNATFEDALRMTMNTESQTEKCSLSSVQEQLSKSLTEHDTVGAVAMDCHGNIACATSTDFSERHTQGHNNRILHFDFAPGIPPS
ncbi:uncharacterized protein LOC5500886 [Nematostella vectensis]|uniref:uncharacterized protein LOC5500886 n=1 Tax=Nematostella vectensis TaxID=45351 RepID=UPI0020774A77|nr:uncharacterized protein LOC5500886 [Nematostella vectensis]